MLISQQVFIIHVRDNTRQYLIINKSCMIFIIPYMYSFFKNWYTMYLYQLLIIYIIIYKTYRKKWENATQRKIHVPLYTYTAHDRFNILYGREREKKTGR